MNRKSLPIAACAALFTLSPFTSSAQAQPAPTLTASTDPATVQEGAYSVEPKHTRVLFSVSHMGFSTWYGEFTNVSGSLDLAPKKIGDSKLEIHIPVNTISTSNTVLDGELKDDKWFDAAKFPEIVFKSDKISQTGKNTASVTGSLTFHGVTKPVTLEVKFHGAGTNIMSKKFTAGFDVSGKIKRSDFGVSSYVPLIGDDVDLIISAAFEHN